MSQQTIDFNRAAQWRAIETTTIGWPRTQRDLLVKVFKYECGPDKTCYASINRLAQDLSVTSRTIRRVLNDLLTAPPPGPYLVRQHRNRDNGSQTTNIITVRWAAFFAGSVFSPPDKMSPPPCQDVTPPLTKCHPHNMNMNGEHKQRNHEALKRQGKTGGWGRPVTREDLRDGHQVMQLWEIALRKGWVRDTEHERHRFFALCRACEVLGKNPGAYLTDCLRKARWNLIRLEDEDRAREVIKRIIHREPQQRTARIDEEAEFEARRQAQINALRAAKLPG